MRQTIANANDSSNSNLHLTDCYCHDDHAGMDSGPNRIDKLRELVEQHPTVAAFARAYDLDVTYIRQLLNGHRNFGEKAAQKMGRKIANDPMLFDRSDTAPPTPANLVTGPPTITETVERLGELLARASPSTRQAVADLLLRYAQEPEEGSRIAQAIELLLREERGDPGSG